MTDGQSNETKIVIPEGFERTNWSSAFGDQVGPIYFRHFDDGGYIRAFPVSDHHINGMGICHGGMLMAFADMVLGHAITRATNRYWLTIRLLTDFISSAKLGDWVEGTAEIVGIEDEFYNVNGRIWVGDKTIMSGTGLFKTLGERPMET